METRALSAVIANLRRRRVSSTSRVKLPQHLQRMVLQTRKNYTLTSTTGTFVCSHTEYGTHERRVFGKLIIG